METARMNQARNSAKALYFSLLLSLLLISPPAKAENKPEKRERPAEKHKDPNIVFILADDMGYGDMNTYNPESKINTPNIDSMASEGMKFTDAHAAAAWCTPSRFGLLTGRYPMSRSMDWTKGSLISPDLTTIAAVLRKRGYRTAAFGKWHLGFDNVNDWHNFDYDTTTIKGGPLDKGFDYFFGIHASLDIPPYFFIYNRHALEAPTVWIHGHQSKYVTPREEDENRHGEPAHADTAHSIQGAFWPDGYIARHYKFINVTPPLTDSHLAVMERDAKPKDHRPFFI